MKIRTMMLAATLALGTASFGPQLSAQPLWDVVKVNLPYTVTLGHKTLPPGEYTIQQLRTPGSKVLLIYNEDGMKFQTSAMTINALKNQTPEDTTVSLHHIGDAYYMDKIFIQGKNYGYEFPLPRRVREREKEMAAVSVKATSSTTDVSTDASADVPTFNADDQTDVAGATTNDVTPAAAAPVPEPAPVVVPEPTPAPVPEPAPAFDQTQSSTQSSSANMADNNNMSSSSANRQRRDDTDNMPKTSAGWLALLLSGGTLSGAGMMLRRKR